MWNLGYRATPGGVRGVTWRNERMPRRVDWGCHPRLRSWRNRFAKMLWVYFGWGCTCTYIIVLMSNWCWLFVWSFNPSKALGSRLEANHVKSFASLRAEWPPIRCQVYSNPQLVIHVKHRQNVQKQINSFTGWAVSASFNHKLQQ